MQALYNLRESICIIVQSLELLPYFLGLFKFDVFESGAHSVRRGAVTGLRPDVLVPERAFREGLIIFIKQRFFSASVKQSQEIAKIVFP